MNFDQGELDLSGNGSDAGHRKWLEELETKKRAFETRFGVILGRRVRVQLVGELHPLEGMIHLLSKDLKQPGSKLRFQLGTREFISSEIQSIIRIDETLT
ncbi:MAG: hypothetical protein ACRDBP_08330 [Luteolibacter sp.]